MRTWILGGALLARARPAAPRPRGGQAGSLGRPLRPPWRLAHQGRRPRRRQEPAGVHPAHASAPGRQRPRRPARRRRAEGRQQPPARRQRRRRHPRRQRERRRDHRLRRHGRHRPPLQRLRAQRRPRRRLQLRRQRRRTPASSSPRRPCPRTIQPPDSEDEEETVIDLGGDDDYGYTGCADPRIKPGAIVSSIELEARRRRTDRHRLQPRPGPVGARRASSCRARAAKPYAPRASASAATAVASSNARCWSPETLAVQAWARPSSPLTE